MIGSHRNLIGSQPRPISSISSSPIPNDCSISYRYKLFYMHFPVYRHSVCSTHEDEDIGGIKEGHVQEMIERMSSTGSNTSKSYRNSSDIEMSHTHLLSDNPHQPIIKGKPFLSYLSSSIYSSVLVKFW